MSGQFSIDWQQRDGQPCLPPALPLEVERLTWRAEGGACAALLSGGLDADLPAFNLSSWAADALRRALVIRNAAGEACWWGYVARVEARQGAAGLVFDLERMANRVAVVYAPRIKETRWIGERAFTPWAEDAASIARYGRKEKMLVLPPLEEGQALAARDAHLRRWALPAGMPFTSRIGAAESRPGRGQPRPGRGESERTMRVRLVCRGWWSTLDWAHPRIAFGWDGFSESAQTSQNFGRTLNSDHLLAQSIRAGYGPFYLGEVGLSARLSGTPTDALVVEVCADASSAPGTVLASANLPAGVISPARCWLRFTFASPPLLQANTPYWLRISRSGAVNATHFYQLFREGSDPYPAGRLCYWGGSAWLDLAGGTSDLNFYFSALQTRSARIVELAGAALGGQFLSGTRLLAAVGGYTPYFCDGVRTCREELLDLLRGGGVDGRRLCAWVSAARELVIAAEPEKDEVDWQIDPQGVIRAPNGRPARLGDALAGRRARLTAGWLDSAALMERVEWTPRGGLRAALEDAGGGAVSRPGAW
ncbi:MAG: choice-of-anchor R domain-containing protein [Chloroflexota bacterium]